MKETYIIIAIHLLLTMAAIPLFQGGEKNGWIRIALPIGAMINLWIFIGCAYVLIGFEVDGISSEPLAWLTTCCLFAAVGLNPQLLAVVSRKLGRMEQSVGYFEYLMVPIITLFISGLIFKYILASFI